MSVLISTDTII